MDKYKDYEYEYYEYETLKHRCQNILKNLDYIEIHSSEIKIFC